MNNLLFHFKTLRPAQSGWKKITTMKKGFGYGFIKREQVIPL